MQIEEDSDLITQIRAISSRKTPDSVHILLDAIWVENEHSMTDNEKIVFYNRRGSTYLLTYDSEAAENSFLQALQYLEKLNDGDLVMKARIMHNRAIIRLHTGRLQEAIDMSRQARTLIGNHPDSMLLAHVYALKGDILVGLGETEPALYYIQRGIDLAAEVNLSRKEAIGLMSVAMLFRDFGEFSQAEENIRRAISIFTELDDQRNLWSTYQNLAVMLIFQDRIEEGLFYARKSDEMAVVIGFPPMGMLPYYWWRGKAYLEENNYYNSLTMFYQALDLAIKWHDIRLKAEVENYIGQAHSRIGNLDKALFYASSALQTAQENRLPHTEADTQRTLAYIYAARGDMDNFAIAMAAERALRDQLLTEQSNRALHEMQVRFETELLNLRITQKRERIRYQYGAIVLLVIISILIVVFQRRRIQNVKRLVRQYESILKLKKETQRQGKDSEKLLSDLQHLFETEKVYRQQGLGIDDVVKKLHTNNKYLSNAINQTYQKDFSEYVNTYRVEEAIEILKERVEGGKYAHYTIQAIAETVGFSSRAAFYSAFKRIVGVTPTEYMKIFHQNEG